jgi:hypothetical protein
VSDWISQLGPTMEDIALLVPQDEPKKRGSYKKKND